MKLALHNLILLNNRQHKELLEIRNSIYVRLKMKTSGIIELENHLKFVETLKDSKKNSYYAVFYDKKIIGAINITDIEKQKCFWGVYFAENISPMISTLVSYQAIDIIFNDLEVEEIFSHVQLKNLQALKFNESLGFSFHQAIEDENKRYNLLSLKLSSWNENKEKGLLKSIGKRAQKNKILFYKDDRDAK